MDRICMCGYTYRGFPMEYAFNRAKMFNYGSVELRDFSDFDFSDLASAGRTLDKAAALSRKYGVRIKAVFKFPPIISNTVGDNGSNALIMDLIPLIAGYGIEIFHTQVHSRNSSYKNHIMSAIAADEDYEKASEVLRHIGDRAAQNNVIIAVESHMGTIHDTAAAQKRLIEMTDHPSVQASLDFANLIIAAPEQSLADAIRMFSGKIAYTHIKNCKIFSWGYDWSIPIKYGDIDYRSLIAILENSGYKGSYGIEYCGKGDLDIPANEDIQYIAGILNEISGYP